MTETGPRNLITDVPGLRVGNIHDDALRSGVTVLLPDAPALAAVDLRGGAPGTRETDALAQGGIVEAVHGLVLSGGSAFGLDAATGVQAWLRERNTGFDVGAARVPIVPQAILFDLLNGGEKDWGRRPPYQDLAYDACQAADADFALGSAGAGYGATTRRLKGGLGSASCVMPGGGIVGALAAVNAAGNATVGDSPCFWAAPFEAGGEFGGLGWPQPLPHDALAFDIKGLAGEATTLVAVATCITLGQSELKRLAIAAQSGLARAIYPVHTPIDGDIVFALSTARSARPHSPIDFAALCTHAANVVARAVARGVYEATAFPDDPGGLPAYRDRFPAPAGDSP